MAALPNIGGAVCQSCICKVWLTPTARVPCSNAVKTRNALKFAGMTKLPNRSQPLVGRSSPYYDDIWTRYCCLIIFFRLSIHAVGAKIQPNKVVRWCRYGDFLAIFCVLYFSEPRAVHFKPAFALQVHQGVTWYGCRPRPGPNCARWGPSSPLRKEHSSPPVFGPCLL